MPIELTTRRNNFQAFERAARQRVKDFANEDLLPKEVDARLVAFLNRRYYNKTHGLTVGIPLSSNQFREFMRDTRFYSTLHNLELRALEDQLNNLQRRNLGTIDRLQKDIDALDSITAEQEIRIYKNYDKAHHNAFVRERDMPLDPRDRRWYKDFKTGLSFGPEDLLHVIPSAGATLPVLDKLLVPIINATLVGEETDVGDTGEPIISSDPRYVFLPGKVFRHVIIRREHDDTTRKYKRTKSFCTLLLELAGTQQINWISFVPAAGSSISIESLTYINASNEEVTLTTTAIEADRGVTLLFEPVRARYMKLKLEQHAPVMKLGRNHFDLRSRELNRLLEGISWESRVNDQEEYIEGRVFDFSIRDIQIGLNQYGTTGLFRSKDIKVEKPASFAVTDVIESIPIVSQLNLSGTTDRLPNGTVFAEYYLGLDLQFAGQVKGVHDLIPVPDSFPVQAEYVPLMGDIGRIKLCPDLLWNLEKIRVVSAVGLGRPMVEITTETPHGLQVDESVSFYGPAGHPLNGDYEVKEIFGDYSFKIRVRDYGTEYAVNENTTPRVFMYRDDSQANDTDNPPFKLYENNVQLNIGDDYQVNFGTSTEWRSTFPRKTVLANILANPTSGIMRVKVLASKADSLYWAEYKPLANQFLGKTKLARLKNGRVVIDPKLKNCKGTVNTICIMRQDFTNPYITPILRNYNLLIRAYK